MKSIEPVRTLASWAVTATALLALWNVFWSGAQALRFKYTFHYTEAIVATAISDLSRNPWLYGPFDAYPHHLMPYTPFYAYLVRGVAALAASPDLVAARALTLMSAFGVIGTMGWVAFRLNRGAWGLWLGAAWISLPAIGSDRASGIPDLAALLWAFWGVAILTVNTQREDAEGPMADWKPLVAGFCFFVAFWTKQSFVAAPLSALLFLGWHKRWRPFWLTAAGFGVPMVLALWIWQSETAGWFWKHIAFSPSTARRYSLKHAAWLWLNFLKPAWPFFAGWILSETLAWRRRAPITAARTYVWCAMATTAALGKSGAGYNYFIEPFAAACLSMLSTGFGPAGRAETSSAGNERQSRVLRGICAGLLVWPLWTAVRVPEKPRFELPERLREQERALAVFEPLIRSVRGDILSEEPGLLVGFGRRVPYEPYEFAQLAYAGDFDEQPMIDRIRAGEFGLIILRVPYFGVLQSERFTRPFLDAVRAHYRPLGTKYGYYFLAPAEGRIHAPAGGV